jgi:TetR/AcrR family transcriptional regulator
MKSESVRRKREPSDAGARSQPQPTLVLPAAPPKRERSAEETKRRILEAALVEFAAKGKDGARLAHIARSASVQAALIHHYFEDKERLYRAVIERTLTAMADEVWPLIAATEVSLSKARGKKRIPREELEALVNSFVEATLRFFHTHGAALALLRHEGDSGTLISDLVRQTVAPLFRALVARIEELQVSGVARRDFDAAHLCLSVMAMAGFPFSEPALTQSLWDGKWDTAKMIEARRGEIVRMVMAILVGG